MDRELLAWIDTLALAVLLVDSDGRIAHASPAFARLAGTQTTALAGTPLHTWLGAEPGTAAALSRPAHQGSPSERAEWLLRGDGTRTPVRVHAATLGAFVALTVRERAPADEAASGTLVGSEGPPYTVLAAVLERLALPVSMVDRSGLVVVWNEAAVRAFGWSREERLGRPHPFARAPEEQAPGASDAPLHGSHYEVRRAIHDGALRTIEMHATRLESSALGHGGTLAIMLDTTEQRATAERLHAAERLEAIGLVAGGVSHDFNNLLTAILANAELGLGFARDTPMLGDMLEDIRDAAQRASALTRQLLTIVRQQPSHPQSTDVNGRLRMLERVLRRLIRAGVQLDLELAPVTPAVFCDPGQIDQVVLNLVLNASDALGESGRIRIATRQDVRGSGDYLVLSVEDDGPGIPEHILPRIFAPFVSTKAAGKGTGLGLSIVERVVTASGGSVMASNVSPHGARFEVLLPAARTPVSPDAPVESAAAAPVGGDEAILVVEDDADVRAALRRTLRALGYHVIEARGVRDAQRVYALAERRIDLALVDLVLPDGSGHALALALRALDPALAVLYASGFVPATGAWDAEIEPLLAKPFDVSTLARKVRAALDRVA